MLVGKKATTRNWLRSDPPGPGQEEIYSMEKLTCCPRTEAEMCEHGWEKWNALKKKDELSY